MKKFIVYHKADFDGVCSAAIISHHFDNEDDVVLVPFDYGDIIDISKFAGFDVYMADCSLPVEDMVKIGEICNKFYWFDHHKSAIQSIMPEISELTTAGKIQTYTNTKQSGCELVWAALHMGKPNGAIDLLGTYDTWRNDNKDRWEKAVLPFQYGLRAFSNNLDPNAKFWASIVDGEKQFIAKVIDMGTYLLQYEREQNKQACNTGSFECKLPSGESAIALCTHSKGSQLFDSIYDEKKHDVMIPFKFNGIEWAFSIYSTNKDIDCSKIAQSFGGGGHKGASGFKMKEFPTWLKKENVNE